MFEVVFRDPVMIEEKAVAIGERLLIQMVIPQAFAHTN
jgi:hypothetical protein